ncbi:MAG: DUF6249 domain-containing protein [Bacteroidales bacterium]|nr:DUF6249 domain-containing protein [Bacteroidales bacterium]
MDIISELIPIVAIISVFGSGIAFIFIISYYVYRSKKSKYDLMAKAVEAGVSLPPDFFKSETKTENSLKRAVILIMLGISLFIAIYFGTDESRIAYFSFIPFLVGIGYLIIYFSEKNNIKEQKPEDNEQK